MAATACTSADPTETSTTAAPVAVQASEDEAAPDAVPLSGPMDDRFEDGSAAEIATTFVNAWRSGDFVTVVRSFDADAMRIIGRELNNGDTGQLSRPGFHLDGALASGEFGELSSLIIAETFTAIDQAGAAPLDFGEPLDAVIAVDETTVEAVFATRATVRFTTVETTDGWRIRRVDDSDADASGEIFGMADPTAGTGWVWCGHGEPVVFEGTDCSRVRAGMDGITEAERADITELREQSLDDPSQALALTQAMQSILGGAPGQVCRLMQRGEVPAGEAQERAQTLSTTVCPPFEPLDFEGLDHSGWRYGELDLSSPTAAVEALVSAWVRNDWWDVQFVLSPGAHDDFSRSLTNLDAEALVADPQSLTIPGSQPTDMFTAIYNVSEPVISVGGLDGPITVLEPDAVLQATTTTGTVTFAVEKAPSGRWRVGAIAEGGQVDPDGPLFQPGTG